MEVKKSFKVQGYTISNKKKLNSRLTATTLLDYVRYKEGKEGLTSDEMWRLFQRQDKQVTMTVTSEDYCMKFYRKGLNAESAEKALREGKLTPGPDHSYSQGPLWITTSIKHSRSFKVGETDNRF